MQRTEYCAFLIWYGCRKEDVGPFDSFAVRIRDSGKYRQRISRCRDRLLYWGMLNNHAQQTCISIANWQLAVDVAHLVNSKAWNMRDKFCEESDKCWHGDRKACLMGRTTVSGRSNFWKKIIKSWWRCVSSNLSVNINVVYSCVYLFHHHRWKITFYMQL